MLDKNQCKDYFSSDYTDCERSKYQGEDKKCYICGSINADFYNECAICGRIFCSDCGTLTEVGETCEYCMD